MISPGVATSPSAMPVRCTRQPGPSQHRPIHATAGVHTRPVPATSMCAGCHQSVNTTSPTRVIQARAPEELYGELPHRTGAVGSLWLHQGDLLRQYAGAHRDTSDLALELPTAP